jgi:hypothetical protein
MRCCSSLSACCLLRIATANVESEGRSIERVWFLLPRLLRRENFTVLLGTGGAGASAALSSVATAASRARRIGSGTSKTGLRSNLRDSTLSDMSFASSRSKSASASGSRSSSGRVTMICSSSSSEELCFIGSSSSDSLKVSASYSYRSVPTALTSPSSPEDLSSSTSGITRSSSSGPSSSSEAEPSSSSGSVAFPFEEAW